MNAARDLTAQGKQVVDAGGVVVEILGSYGGPTVSKANLESWITSHKLPVTTVRDVPASAGASMTALERREIAYIVDLKTMKIVNRYLGSVAGVGDSAVKSAVKEILQLLAE